MLELNSIALLVGGLIVLLVIVTVVKSVQIIPQASVAIVERLGRYKGTKEAGLAFLVPFVDKVRQRVDLRRWSPSRRSR
jgi:regulator of protease activity HflC (stomatin/prohibitin superfamily)